MKNYSDEKVRNFCLVGHAGAGKTTLAEQILLKSGVINRLGNVQEGTTISDFRAEEKERQNSIFASPLHCEWNDFLFHFIDTPGFPDFQGDKISAMRTADGTIFVIEGSHGIETGTVSSWKHAKSSARAFVINSLDKEQADFWEILKDLQENYGATHCVPLTIPIGKGETFSGVINVLTAENVPQELQEIVKKYREIIMDTIAEHDEELMGRYLAGEKITAEEISKGLHNSINDTSLIPVFAVSAIKGIGVEELMTGIVNLMPRPWNGRFPDLIDNSPFVYSADGNFIARAFKSVNDPFIGQLTYLRVYSGILKADSEVYNISQKTKERIGHLLFVNGKNTIQVEQAGPGCIVAVAKLKTTRNGDTLACKENATEIIHIPYPTPTVMHSVYPVKKGDDEKIAAALQKFAEEDPTIRLEQQAETHEFLCSTMGDLQFTVIEHRLKNEYKVEVNFRTPKVPYRETITKSATGFYRHKKQSGGAGQFGEVHLRLEPCEEMYEFISEVVGGSIPKNYFPAIEKGVKEAILEGYIAHCPIINVKVAIYDGKYHDVDSNEISFKIAGKMAIKEVIPNCKPILLEPIMELKIATPDEYVGDVSGDISIRRGHITGISVEDGLQIIEAEVPMAETFTYSQSLRSLTQGKGSFQIAFKKYMQAPANIAEQVKKIADLAFVQAHE